MRTKGTDQNKSAKTHQKTGELLRSNPEKLLPEDARLLIHELQVHQIELEMQNEELRLAQEALEISRANYANLYDFSPVSYFTFDKNGLILEVNLTGAGLLGIERSLLIKMPFSRFIEKNHQDLFYLHCKKVFDSSDRHTCEVRLEKKDGAEVYAQLESIRIEDPHGNNSCRTSVVDITERKLAEENLKKELNLRNALLNNIPSMIALVLKKQTREVVACNDLAKQFGAVIGKTCFETIAKKNMPCPFCKATELWSTCEKQEVESEYIGRFWREYWFPLTDDLFVHYIFDVTERKRTEESFRKNEARLKDAQRQGKMGDWETDLATNVLSWSDEVYIIFGMNPDRNITIRIEDFISRIHPNDRQRVKDFLKETVDKAYDSWEMEYRISLDSGEDKHIFVSAVVEMNDEGKPVRRRGIVQDITERKQAEEVLRKSEEKFRSLFDNAEVGMFRTKLDGSNILDMNEKFLSIFGFTREEMQGSPSIIHWVDPREREEMVRRLQSEGRVIDFGCKMLNKQGEIRQCITSLRLYREQGILEGSIIDITEQRNAEKHLIESEARYRTLLNSVTDYIYTVEIKDGKTVSTSHGPGCVAVTGYSPEDFRKDPYLWYNMIYPDDKDNVRALLKDIFLDREIYPVEHRIVCKNGAVKWVRNATVKHYDDKGNIIAYDGLVSDITEQKKLELQLQHVHKMESIGTLAGGIAHDFNNILTAIIGFASIVNKRMSEDDPLHVFVDNIEEAAEKAANLTKSLLTFSRKHQANPITVNISEIISKMEKIIRRIMGEDIELKLAVAQNALYVKADIGQIE